MTNGVDHILLDHALRLTDSRQQILNVFIRKGSALSHSEIENTISSQFDRVTVYRTLKSFLEKGIIHKVLDDGTGIKYALCKEHCRDSQHSHEHVHFKCNECGETNCIEDVVIPTISLPNGYKAFEKNLLIQGVCANCNK
jgi:Fur family ferric uptake transcriptional regulator